MIEGLDYRLLGPLRVWRDGVQLELHGNKLRAVLALMLTRSGRVVPLGAFADEVWERDPVDIAANLQVVVSNLRKVLGADAIATHPAGYSVAAAQSHLLRFRRLRAEGDSARADRRPAEAARCYAQALAEWDGERALLDVRERFADPFAQALDEELLACRQVRAEAGLAAGLDMVGELVALSRRYPLHAAICGQLLVALVRAGRVADAAEEYHAFRERCDEQLGADVPATLRSVWADLARGHEPPDAYRRVSPAAPAAVSTGDHVLATAVDDDVSARTCRLRHRDGTVSELTGRVTLGRVGCDVTLADAKVSRSHAVLSPTTRGFVLDDLHSTNGTFVNGRPLVEPTLLADGDVVRLGDTELVFDGSASAQPV